MLDFINLKPKIYKKNLYVGEKKIFRLTLDYTKKFLVKVLWYFIIIAMLITMIFGGLALILGPSQPTPPQEFSPLNLPN